MPNLRPASARWKRALAISGIAFLCSLGLCGINYSAYQAAQGNAPLQDTLTAAGIVELAVIAVALLGLVVSVFGLAISAILSRNSNP